MMETWSTRHIGLYFWKKCAAYSTNGSASRHDDMSPSPPFCLLTRLRMRLVRLTGIVAAMAASLGRDSAGSMARRLCSASARQCSCCSRTPVDVAMAVNDSLKASQPRKSTERDRRVRHCEPISQSALGTTLVVRRQYCRYSCQHIVIGIVGRWLVFWWPMSWRMMCAYHLLQYRSCQTIPACIRWNELSEWHTLRNRWIGKCWITWCCLLPWWRNNTGVLLAFREWTNHSDLPIYQSQRSTNQIHATIPTHTLSFIHTTVGWIVSTEAPVY